MQSHFLPMDSDIAREIFRHGSLTNATHQCTMLPSNSNSDGVWDKLIGGDYAKWFWEYSLPLAEMLFVLIFFLYQGFNFFLARFGFVRLTSELLAGIMISRLALSKSTVDVLFPQDYKASVIGVFGGFAYLMFWFQMGVKMDVGLISKSGRKALAIGIGSVLIPLFICAAGYHTNIKRMPTEQWQYVDWEIGATIVIQSLTTFPVIGSLVFELKIQNSELGRLVMSSAMVNDFVSTLLLWLVFLLVTLAEASAAQQAVKFSEAAQLVGMLVALVLFAVYVFRPVTFWVIRMTPEGKPVQKVYIYSILIVVLGSAVYSHYCKQFLALGPFILGLAIPEGPPLGSEFEKKLEVPISGTLLPLFTATSSMDLDFNAMEGIEKNIPDLVLAIFYTLVTKFVVAIVPALISKMPVKDCLALALLMCYKGIVELGAHALALNSKMIRPGAFSLMIVYILVNSVVIPLLVKYLYDPSKIYMGYKKRNMMHLKPNSELRIVSCIHRPDDINPMINILEALCPTKENPIIAYVIHLVELIGRANPLFISHQIQTRRAENTSYSENVIISFNQLQREYWDCLTVNTFTSVSIPKTMHEDICLLAMNHAASLILLPFHQAWSADGSTVVSNNEMIRSLNCSVLQKAPCSIGILVDRSRLNRRKEELCIQRLCMIFLGGEDDREALIVAKRIANDESVTLTVIKLVPATDMNTSDWDKMLDAVALQDLRHNNGQGRVSFLEEVVKDGSETPLVLKELVDNFDLFVVGRGFEKKNPLTEGLVEWSEFKELGVIGDLLTSADVNKRASVLVVQQQQQRI